MDESLDQRIRNNDVSNLDMSLDEYIYMNNIGKPQTRGRGGGANNRNEANDANESGPSKFDRYRHQDDDDDDDGGEMDEDTPNEMPKLVPFEMKTLPPKPTKPIHQRLGERGSICESIHTSQMNLYQPNKFKAKKRVSVQNRLGKAWVNPITTERNRIALHTLKSIVDNPRNMIEIDDDGRNLLSAFAKVIKNAESVDGGIKSIQSAQEKYNMDIQKEISMVQGKPLTYKCPGGFVISSDGPGIGGFFKVPSHKTGMSMNQRFA